MKKKIKLGDAVAYFTGNYRYKLYYTDHFRFLIRDHIQEQIAARILSMDDECLMNGECKMCGCQTTALQMANKACAKPCYPEMMNEDSWGLIKNGYVHQASNGMWSLKEHEEGKYIFYKRKTK